MGRLCLLTIRFTWSLPQLLWALSIPHFFCGSKTLLRDEVGSIVGFLTNGEKMKSKQVKWTSLVGVFALIGMPFFLRAVMTATLAASLNLKEMKKLLRVHRPWMMAAALF